MTDVARPFQSRAIELVHAAYVDGMHAVLLVVPTGGGKTFIAGRAILRAVARGKRVLFVVHRRELAWQASRRLTREGIEHGIVMAGEVNPNPNAAVQIVSVQTLVARGERPPADLIVWDEAHHVVAATFRDVRAAYPLAYHLGLSATPGRADGVGLGGEHGFERMVAPVAITELIADGYLVDCDVIAPPTRLQGISQDPLDAWRKHAGERPGVVFAPDRPMAHALAERFNAAGITAACIDGDTDAGERDAALERFAAGELRVLVNVYVLTEGWDCPRAEVCMIARGCGSAATYLQMVGRVLRPYPGKSRALLIDLAGVVHEHGLPTEDREYSLDGNAIKTRDRVTPLRTCLECGATFKTKPECPRCGFKFPVREVRTVGAEIARVFAIVPTAEKRAVWDRLCAECVSRGFAPGWASHKFRARFGHWPATTFPRVKVSA